MGSEDLNIVSLDHAYPSYDPKDIKIKKKNKKLFIAFPENIRRKFLALDNKFNFNSNISFDCSTNFTDIERETGIEGLCELIEKHREIVAIDFLKQMDQQFRIFNGNKYGIYCISCGRSSDKDERSKLRIDVFETDYFTHRVFRSIYKELCENNHPISKVKKEDVMKYRAFTTSFGINTYVLLNTENGKVGEEIVFAKRSKFIANSEGKSKWHATVNEALTQSDYDQGNVSLLQCLYRGLREEVGVLDKHKDFIDEKKIFDLFLERRNFEMGITSIVKMDISFKDLLYLHQTAKDGALEIDELSAVPFKKNDIDQFISENKNNMTNIGLYTLYMILAREVD
jgi:hypothetical protein